MIFFADIFTPEEHSEINEILSGILKDTPSKLTNEFLTSFLTLLCSIIGRMKKPQLISTASMTSYIAGFVKDRSLNYSVEKILQSREYSRLANLRFFRTSENVVPIYTHSEGVRATLLSWRGEYVGTAAQALLETMESHQKANERDVYAKYITIVQSSGMGKSRMVDELSKQVLVFPINLRDGNESERFPTPDNGVRNFLTSTPFSSADAQLRSQSFLIALFKNAENLLKDIDSYLAPVLLHIPDKDHPRDVVNKFRLFMTTGQRYRRQGKLRTDFYDDVVQCAAQLMLTPLDPTKGTTFTNTEATLTIALEALLARITNDPNRSKSRKIDVVIAFDESHILNTPTGGPQDPNRLTALRRALRALRLYPVFTLFISANGKTRGPIISAARNSSGRLIVARDVAPYAPFTELGFDQMVDFNLNEVSIFDLSRVKYMVKFGRPSFGSFYKCGDSIDKFDITRTAGIKLLGGDNDAGRLFGQGMVTPDAKLACMSVRLALELTTMTVVTQKRELEHVENYLRVCIAVDKDFRGIVTVSPSEPLLATSAQAVMRNANLPKSLLEELQTPGIIKDFRGELVALVILILAIDATVESSRAPPNPLLKAHPHGEYWGETWLSTVRSIEMFMQNLLPDGSHQDLLTALPSTARTGEEGKQDFKTTFKDSKIYFNHFIKLDDRSMLSREHLYKLIARGAAVLCADYQMGVNIIIPFLFRGEYLNATNVSAILIQAKNNPKFTHIPCDDLYDFMDPFDLGFFTTPMDVVPVIRVVFALAASESAVEIVKPATREAGHPQPYTSYDIWCADVSSETFKVVEAEDHETYKQLLAIGSVRENACIAETHSRSLLRRQMNPGIANE